MLNQPTHQPSTSATKQSDFGGASPFTVKPEISAEDALALASEYLLCASATAYETADNCSPEFRALARSVVHQIEAAKALVDASACRLEGTSIAT